jgi:site-specific DNA-methyltransferase (adenine-specific)
MEIESRLSTKGEFKFVFEPLNSCRRAEIHLADSRKLYELVQPDSVDCIVTDPAYWTLEKHRGKGTTTRLGGHMHTDKQDNSKWFSTVSAEDLIMLIDECSRVLKKNGHLWMMCDGETLAHILWYGHYGNCHDFGYIKPYPVIKKSSTGGFRLGMGYHGRGAHEYVVLMEKGRRRFTDENWPDVFEYEWTGGKETSPFTGNGKPYPTAKPLVFFERLIELSSLPDETVMDPFLGGGTSAVAAYRKGRRFIGMDINPTSILTTFRRLDFESNVQDGLFSHF